MRQRTLRPACDGAQTVVGLRATLTKKGSRNHPSAGAPCRCRQSLSSGRTVRHGMGNGQPRRAAHGLHDHGQFGQRKGDASAATARRSVSVRRVGGAGPSRLAGFGVPAGRSMRSARHLRPFRWQHRVLFGSGGCQRVSAGGRDGARLVQRILPRIVLPLEGGLSFRLQHAECGAGQEPLARGRAQPGPRRALAGRAPTAWRARWVSATAKAAAIACVASS